MCRPGSTENYRLSCRTKGVACLVALSKRKGTEPKSKSVPSSDFSVMAGEQIKSAEELSVSGCERTKGKICALRRRLGEGVRRHKQLQEILQR